MFSCGSQNAMSTSSEASNVLGMSVSMRFIILFRVVPKLIDWKSIVLVNTKRTGSSSIDIFFFQAEDGIRDIGVTGVQTCALPISGWRALEVPVPGDRQTWPTD